MAPSNHQREMERNTMGRRELVSLIEQVCRLPEGFLGIQKKLNDNTPKSCPCCKSTTARFIQEIYLGCYAIILGDIVVGENAVVGAGIVVTKSVSANSTIVGSPARINRIGDNDD